MKDYTSKMCPQRLIMLVYIIKISNTKIQLFERFCYFSVYARDFHFDLEGKGHVLFAIVDFVSVKVNSLRPLVCDLEILKIYLLI